jgi:hypothetical protein
MIVNGIPADLVRCQSLRRGDFGLLMTLFLAERTIVQIHIGTTICVAAAISCQEIRIKR